MEYSCKNSKIDKKLTVYLGELTMRLHMFGKDEIVHYSIVENVNIKKEEHGRFSIEILTADKNRYVIGNIYHHKDGTREDKSVAYADFVRTLIHHLHHKSKAQIKCIHHVHTPEWQKLLLVVFIFVFCYWVDARGFKLFHPIVHGIALSSVMLMLVFITEKIRSIDNLIQENIPRNFLPH